MDFSVLKEQAAAVSAVATALELDKGAIEAAVLRSYTLNANANFTRLAKVLEKAKAGEPLVVAGLGGSITAGAAAKSKPDGSGNNAAQYTELLGGEKCWFDRTVEWVRQQYPQTKIRAVNAGIGATPSFLGTFRMESMVLSHKPDLVFVEFSVNDPSTKPKLLNGEYLDAYESVVRRCLEAGAAVVQVFLNDNENNGMQAIHSRIASHYQVPTVSYHNAISPEGAFICPWERLSPDDIHPNNAGHALLGLCVSNLLGQVQAGEPVQIPENWLFRDTFHKVNAFFARDLVDCADAGFAFCTDTPHCAKWNGTLVSSGTAKLRMNVPKGAKRIFVLAYDSTGAFETKFLQQQAVFNTQAADWPRAMWYRFYTGPALQEDTELTLCTHEDGQVILLGVLCSM